MDLKCGQCDKDLGSIELKSDNAVIYVRCPECRMIFVKPLGNDEAIARIIKMALTEG